MRKFFILFIFAGIAFSVKSQLVSDLILLTKDSTFLKSSAMAGLRVEGEYFSNSINNDFVSKLIQGGFIDEGLKSSVYDKLDESNIAFAQLAADLYFYNMADTIFPNRNWGLALNIGARVDAQTVFSDDLFRLGFSGNKPFTGKAAELSESSGSFVQYQKVGIGLFHKSTFSGLNLSFVNGQDLFQTQIDQGQLYTSENGDSLALQYNGESWYSDDSKKGIGVGNGAGAALDFFWNLNMADGKGLLMVGLQDLGFIQWSSSTRRLSSDTTFSFIGWDLEEILDSDNPINFSSLQDSLAVNEESKAHTTLLPAKLTLSLIRKLGEKYYYKVSIRSRFLDVVFPEVSGGVLYKPNEILLAGASVSYSVYGNVRFGLKFEYMPGKTWLMQINSNDFLGLLNINERGRAASLSISKFF